MADRDGDRDQVDGFGTRGPVGWVSGELADLVVTGAFASSSASSLKSKRRWASSLTDRTYENIALACDAPRKIRPERYSTLSHL
jgi:hypothetical protein